MNITEPKASTLAAAEEIKVIELFKHCGELVADEDVIQVLSWDGAIAAPSQKIGDMQTWNR